MTATGRGPRRVETENDVSDTNAFDTDAADTNAPDDVPAADCPPPPPNKASHSSTSMPDDAVRWPSRERVTVAPNGCLTPSPAHRVGCDDADVMLLEGGRMRAMTRRVDGGRGGNDPEDDDEDDEEDEAAAAVDADAAADDAPCASPPPPAAPAADAALSDAPCPQQRQR